MNIDILNHLNHKIYEHEMNAAATYDRLAQAKIELSRQDAAIEQAIANDKDLKNEQQRKAAKLEARDDNEYQLALADVRRLEDQTRQWDAMIGQAKREFEINRLGYRHTIAIASQSIAA